MHAVPQLVDVAILVFVLGGVLAGLVTIVAVAVVADALRARLRRHPTGTGRPRRLAA